MKRKVKGKGYKTVVEGVIHTIPPATTDSEPHITTQGAAGCWCEPEIREVRKDGNRVVTRVIFHNQIKTKKVKNG